MKKILIMVIAPLIVLVLSVSFLVFDVNKYAIAESPALEEVIYDLEGVISHYIDAINDTDTEAYVHAKENVGCLDCHDLEVLRQLYLQCSLDAIELEKSNMVETSNELCLTCHGGYEELVELTKDSKVYGAIDGESWGNPHTHAMEDGWNCSDCHSNHEISIPVSKYYCMSCHHVGNFISCYSSGCHDQEEKIE
jgi:hypothetical protein